MFPSLLLRERRGIGKSKSWMKCFWGKLEYLDVRVFFCLDWGYIFKLIKT